MHASPSAAHVTVRLATMQDAARLAELCGQLGYPSTTEEVERRLRLILPDQESAVFIAESGGNVVGWIDVFVSRLVETDQHAEIGGFVVDEGCRSQGVGRLLLERAEEWARAEGCSVMTLRSNVIREKAHTFYQNSGYAVVKTQKAFRKTL